MKLIFKLLLVFLATTQIAMAGGDAQKFNRANRLYLDHEYEKAIDLYNSIDISNPDLEYNLAGAYFEADQIGKAILHLSRAIKLRPDDEDTIVNLRYIKSIKQDREPETKAGYITTMMASIENALPINTMIGLTLLLYLMSALALLGLIKGNKNFRRKISPVVIFFVFITTVSAAVTYHRISQFERADRAIAIEKAIDAYSGPSDITGKLFTFHEGTEVTIGREDGAYAFVTLSSGLSGWSKVESLERI